MATDPATLQSWRDSLFAARLNGIREVVDANGERVYYKSDAEMASALAAADRALLALSGQARITTIRFRTSKGLCQ